VNRKHILIVAATILIVLVAAAAVWILSRPKRRWGVYDIPSATATPATTLIQQSRPAIPAGLNRPVGEVRAYPLEMLFPEVQFYLIPRGSSLIGQKNYTIVAVREDAVYWILDFNQLLADTNKSATRPEQEMVMQAFAILAQPNFASLPITFEGYNQLYSGTEDDPMESQEEITSWSRVNGVRVRWTFTFWGSEIDRVAGEVLALEEGLFVSRHVETPYKTGPWHRFPLSPATRERGTP
jgi:hypothetical protein